MDVRRALKVLVLGGALLAVMSYFTGLRGKHKWSNFMDFPDGQWDIPGECRPGGGNGKVPNTLHFVWNDYQLSPPVLALIDSVARHMPTLEIKIHFIAEEEGLEDKTYKQLFTDQLRIWKDIAKFTVIQYDSINEVSQCTPFEKSTLTSRLSLKDNGDILRLLVLWNDGGIFVDPSILFMRNVLPLLELTQGVAIARDHFKESDIFPTVGDAFLAFPKGHRLVWAAMHTVRSKLDNLEDSMFPNRTVAVPLLGPRPIGLAAFQWAHAGGTTYFVTSPNEEGCSGPHNIIQDRVDATSFKGHWLGLLRTAPKVRSSSLYIFDRGCFLPAPWGAKSMQTADASISVALKKMELDCEAPVGSTLVNPLVKALCHGYSFNLGATKKNTLVSENFVSLISAEPKTVLGFVYEKTCLKICDPTALAELAGQPTDSQISSRKL